MNFNEHQKICIANVIRIARLRGLAVDDQDPKYVKLGLTWSAELQVIPVSELRPAIDDAWRWADQSVPFAVDQVLSLWKSNRHSPNTATASREQWNVMANCAHEFNFFEESTALYEGLWECYKCGKARPKLREGRSADYLRSAGVTA